MRKHVFFKATTIEFLNKQFIYEPVKTLWQRVCVFGGELSAEAAAHLVFPELYGVVSEENL